MKKKLRAIQFKKFDGAGTEVSLEKLKEHLWSAERVELFSTENIIKLNIRFGELYHICDDQEWNDYKCFLNDNAVSIKINKWWQFWN